MSALVDEPKVVDEVLVEPVVAEEIEAWERNRDEVLAANRDASTVDGETLAAFLDLLAGADAEYLSDEHYAEAVPEPEPASDRPILDWDAVSQALAESQQILIGVQKLLSETLADMGIEDHAFIRVYSDTGGQLRLTSDHPRRAEIEAALNGPNNRELRNLYAAAMSGMGLAGGLVGSMSVPEGVLEQIKAKQHAA